MKIPADSCRLHVTVYTENPLINSIIMNRTTTRTELTSTSRAHLTALSGTHLLVAVTAIQCTSHTFLNTKITTTLFLQYFEHRSNVLFPLCSKQLILLIFLRLQSSFCHQLFRLVENFILVLILPNMPLIDMNFHLKPVAIEWTRPFWHLGAICCITIRRLRIYADFPSKPLLSEMI